MGDDAVGRGGQAVYLQGILQTGAAAVGGIRALVGPGASGGPEVEAAAAARTAVHRLQKETVRWAAMRRTVGRKVVLVQEVLHLLIRRLLQLKDTQVDSMNYY